MDNFQMTASYIKRLPTDVPGLKFFPSLEPEISNDADSPIFPTNAQVEVSDCNRAVVGEVVRRMGSDLRAIMEIGVARNGPDSMSMILIRDKPDDAFYLGVDLDDKSFLDDPSRNAWTLMCNSHDQATIRAFLAGKGIDRLDLLFIDGWHSVNTCVNDWLYTDLMGSNGVVILHDTNAHPGCVALFEAVDETLWEKRRYCTDFDNGIAVFGRR